MSGMAEQIVNKRVCFAKGKQRLFIDSLVEKLYLDNDKLCESFNIKKRTLSDWRREISTMSYGALLGLCRKHNISFPKEVRVMPQFWYVRKGARKGGLIRNEKYGNPATAEGRRRGGLTTMRKFFSDPDLAKKLKVRIRKDISFPSKSARLAEFLGIMIGDGSLTDYQVRITLNRYTDIGYASFVEKLIKELFDVSPVIIRHKLDKSNDIVVYSKNLTGFLEEVGLKKGNKIKNNIDMPHWIKRNRAFKVACLRGLVDTDGSFYHCNHKAKRRTYSNFAFCFTSRSKKILKSVFDILKTNKLAPAIYKERVYLYRMESIKRYFEIVNSHNQKHFQKYASFVKIPLPTQSKLMPIWHRLKKIEPL
jgi:intein/homing endonuclease